MNNEEVTKKVCNMVADQMCEETSKVNAESRFKEDLGMDSLDVTELVMNCEREFKVTINDEEYANFTTVGELANLIASK
jgi:acyl carrier protein